MGIKYLPIATKMDYRLRSKILRSPMQAFCVLGKERIKDVLSLRGWQR